MRARTRLRFAASLTTNVYHGVISTPQGKVGNEMGGGLIAGTGVASMRGAFNAPSELSMRIMFVAIVVESRD